MKIGPLREIILYVTDMETQLRFYRDVMGLEVTYPLGLESYAGEYWVTLDSGPCVLALHGGGQGRMGQDTPKLVFAVTDIVAARATLMARGVKMETLREAAPGVRVVDGRDPEGTPFSIEERQG